MCPMCREKARDEGQFQKCPGLSQNDSCQHDATPKWFCERCGIQCEVCSSISCLMERNQQGGIRQPCPECSHIHCDVRPIPPFCCWPSRACGDLYFLHPFVRNALVYPVGQVTTPMLRARVVKRRRRETTRAELGQYRSPPNEILMSLLDTSHK